MYTVNAGRRADRGTLSDLKKCRINRVAKRAVRQRPSDHRPKLACVGKLVYGFRLLCGHDLWFAQKLIHTSKFWYPNPGGMIDVQYRVRVS